MQRWSSWCLLGGKKVPPRFSASMVWAACGVPKGDNGSVQLAVGLIGHCSHGTREVPVLLCPLKRFLLRGWQEALAARALGRGGRFQTRFRLIFQRLLAFSSEPNGDHSGSGSQRPESATSGTGRRQPRVQNELQQPTNHRVRITSRRGRHPRRRRPITQRVLTLNALLPSVRQDSRAQATPALMVSGQRACAPKDRSTSQAQDTLHGPPFWSLSAHCAAASGD